MGVTNLLSEAGAVVVALATGVAAYLGIIDPVNEYANLNEEQINAVIDAKYLVNMDNYLPDLSVLDNITTSINVDDGTTEVAAKTEIDDGTTEVAAKTEIDDGTKELIAKTEVEEYPDVASEYNAEVMEAVELLKELQANLRDQRSVMRDEGIFGGKTLRKWMKLYAEYKDKPVDKLNWESSMGKRIIAEVRVPRSAESRDTLVKNLQYYTSRGYDGVLVVFDGSESPAELQALVTSLKKMQLAVWYAFGGEEHLKVSVFPEPEKLKRQIQALASGADAWIVGWRRTSAHLLEQDGAYMNYFANVAREVNPKLQIIGEVYYGETASHSASQPGWSLNLPAGAGAATLCNFGYTGVAVESVVQKRAANQTSLPLVAVIGGERAYYLTTNRNDLSQEQNQAIKEKLEKRFAKAGVVATLTVHDDGHDNYKGVHSGDLGTTLYSDLQ